MNHSLKIETKKQIYTLLLILAALFSLSIAFLYYVNNFPLDLQINSKRPLLNHGKIQFFMDLNDNGQTEKVILGIDKDSVNFFIAINDDNNRIFRQYNFSKPISSENIFFEDFNNDNFKDLFILYKQNESLFFSVIDIKEDKYYINKLLLLTKPDSAKKNYWDVNIIFGGLVNSHNFVFSISGAYSLYPRTVYSFNLLSKKIVHSFPTHASIMKINLIDLNNDNKKEIVVKTVATGNIVKTNSYDDQTNWLFILDQNLKPVQKPLNFGSYPSSSFSVKPYLYNNKHYFSIATETTINRKRINEIFTINSKGKIIFEKFVPVYINDHFIIYDQNNNPKIVLTTFSGSILVYDNSLNLLSKYETDLKFLKFVKVLNLSNIESNLILAQNNNRLIVFNDNFKREGQLTLGDIPLYDKYNFSIEKTPLDKNEPLFVLSNNNMFEITVEQNFYYKYLQLLFLLHIFLTFIFLLIFHKILSLLSTYTKFFTHQLQHSPNGIIILNSDGKLQYSNKKVNDILIITSGLIKGNYYKKIFIPFNDIIDNISKAINTKQKTRGNISYNLSNKNFNGEIVVTPFISKIGFTYAYLIQIIDHTLPITSDRMKTWSSTIQHIAHEIKTPLSGINLGLDTLAKRLSRETDKYTKDISLIQNEVDRIRNLTKNFLLFSNQEKPNLIKINLDDLLQESFIIFQSYFNSGIKILYDKSDYVIYGDGSQLKQLFHIVIENAIDACGGKGKIEVKTEDRRQETGKLEIKITVSDNGKGILDEELSKIFEPYYTTKKDGTGVGLAIAKKIVEDHKGKIVIESKLEEGTKVYIYLPAIEYG